MKWNYQLFPRITLKSQNVYYRYVDDILIFLPGNKINYILQKFKYENRLNFTIEIPSKNNMNFLDLTVSIENYFFNKLFSQKPWSIFILIFQIHKRSVIIGLVNIF